MRLFGLMCLLFVLLLGLALPVLAQETPDIQLPVIPLVSDQSQTETMAQNLFSLIYNATYLPFASGMVLLLVAVSKRLPFLQNTSGDVLALFFTVILWALWTTANEIGYGTQFESITTSLVTMGSAILGITITPIAASRLYSVAQNNNVAVLGYARSIVSPASPRLTLADLDKAVYSQPTPSTLAEASS